MHLRGYSPALRYSTQLVSSFSQAILTLSWIPFDVFALGSNAHRHLSGLLLIVGVPLDFDHFGSFRISVLNA